MDNSENSAIARLAAGFAVMKAYVGKIATEVRTEAAKTYLKPEDLVEASEEDFLAAMEMVYGDLIDQDEDKAPDHSQDDGTATGKYLGASMLADILMISREYTDLLFEYVQGQIGELSARLMNMVLHGEEVQRLVELGYGAEELERALTLDAELPAERVELREGLASLNYSPREIEDCMEDVPDLTLADIEHAKTILDAWDPSVTGRKLERNWQGDKALVVFPKIDTRNVVSMQNCWENCTNLAYMPDLETTNCISFSYLYFISPGYGSVPANKMRRIPRWSFRKATYLVDVYPYNMTEMIFPEDYLYNGMLQAFYATSLRVMQGIKNENLPQMYINSSIVKSFQNNWADTNIKKLPYTSFTNATTNISNIYALCRCLTDLGDVTLRAPSVTNASQMFSGCENLTRLPKRIEFAPGVNLKYAFRYLNKVEEIPDYSNLEPVDVENLFIGQWTKNSTASSRLRAIRGLNFARLETMGEMIHASEIVSGTGYYRNFHLLTYIRIINLGQGSCTNYDFRCAKNWGSTIDSRQSLLDTLITDSYDRAANGMPVATIQLPSTVMNRLSTEEKAQITAKGFTLVSNSTFLDPWDAATNI